MPNLLIHSMKEFSDIILPALELAEVTDIVEIGAEFGGMTFTLADYCEHAGGKLTSIDPSPKQEFIDWMAQQHSVSHVAKPSLDAIADLAAPDAWLIDGDHNWYTVYHELKAIRDLCRAQGQPMLIFMHDIGWPGGRRDMYYAPDRIPHEYRHAHSFDGGTTVGVAELTDHRGFRGMGQFALALHEGGPRNGVLTAAEDFLAEELAADRPYGFAQVPGVFGLGVIFDLDQPWSEKLAEFIMPYHQNRLLARLESNRLANYLTVIEWQDREAARLSEESSAAA